MVHKPRILFLATFPPPVHGSAVVSKQIKESKTINGAFDGDYVNIGTSRKVEEIGKKSLFVNLKKGFRYLGMLARIFFLLLTHKYDLCYCAITCRGKGFIKDVPVVLLCKLFNRKTVIHQHNKGMSEYVNRRIYKFLYKKVYTNTKVILLSEQLYSDISSLVKREDVMLCPNGIKPSLDSVIAHGNSQCPHILFLSNLMIAKGVMVLLDALKILKEKGYTFVCDFVGSKTKEIDQQRFSSEVSSRGLEGYALYHGAKYGAEKYGFFQAAEMFVLPSFNEAFPLVNLEAMEYSLPIVSTNVGGIPDQVNDGVNGYIIEPGDVVALADKLAALLDAPQLRVKMGQTGRSYFEARYTEEQFEACMTRCLNECM